MVEQTNQNIPESVVQNLPVVANQTWQQATQNLPQQVKQTVIQNRVPIAVGVGAIVLTPIILPLLKPVAKATIKTGVSFLEKTKGALAETVEIFGDIVAEAKAEVAAEAQHKSNLKAGIYSQQELNANKSATP
ncbi:MULTISPECIES: DUF5132 domain-containing protein [Okeania]|uniref:DUF5132 domain-containing protein n=1 Tax=Okeania hirsuta TaxID=1458930 RepID=A0A3N6NXU9_9CYAN|nr:MULTISPECIES: DUF5132 domain-containing protein [Okeania]NES91566.1 DUF5132 domain-containing protein [Okeania sp. SIO2B9]NET77394.1 DUF5132 domain-containing protein [Okeania sp. SIO1F9]RQH24897.1 DUF5132 domain-containing protein [Okeania hirsuta]RQH53559.1 DUF5132 domain-containing protein [Okeania hirsuta]